MTALETTAGFETAAEGSREGDLGGFTVTARTENGLGRDLHGGRRREARSEANEELAGGGGGGTGTVGACGTKMAVRIHENRDGHR